jgi:hypothetical protein
VPKVSSPVRILASFKEHGGPADISFKPLMKLAAAAAWWWRPTQHQTSHILAGTGGGGTASPEINRAAFSSPKSRADEN